MRSRLLKALVAEVYIVGLLGFFVLCGFYTIPPTTLTPEGRTRIVIRAAGEPFFNSPVLECLERVGNAGLGCLAEQIEQRALQEPLLEVPFVPWTHERALKAAAPEA